MAYIWSMPTIIDTREARGLTQQTVATKAGISRSHYRRIEQGLVAPSVLLAQRISRILGTTVERLWPPE